MQFPAKRDYVLVALGDSYSAGEGMKPFFGQDSSNKYSNPDWVAHRSELAWSGRLNIDSEIMCVPMSGNRDKNWFFVADSGATVPDIFNTRTKDVNYQVRSSLTVLPVNKFTTVDLDPQINVFDTLDSKGLMADYVTMTMGGNDMGFVDVVKEAATCGRWNPKNFTDKLNKKCEKMDSVVSDLKEAYTKISDRAGRQATIIIAGYPPLMNPHGSFIFPECNSVNVNAKIRLFNSKIEEAINDLRETKDIKIYYASVYEGFSGHEAYSDDSYLNELTFSSKDTEDIDMTDPISAHTMHPNDRGAQVYADAVQAVIDQCEADRTAHFEKLRMPDEAKLGNGREYKGLVEGFVKEHGEPKKTVDNFSGFEGTFCRLIDFNRDGVTELFIAAQDASAYVYTLKDGDIEELHWDVLRDEPIGKEYDMNTVINYGFAVNIGISADPYEVASANYKKICRS
jgi:lysophospholipase L1-like esterase